MIASRPVPEIRVTFFDPYSRGFGGGQRILILLAQELMKRGIRASVLTPEPGPFSSRLDDAEIPWRVLPLPPELLIYGRGTSGRKAIRAAGAMPSMSVRLGRQLKAETDLLHANDLRGILLAGSAARLGGVPAIWHVHAVTTNKRLNRVGGALASSVIVPSAAAGRMLPGVGRSQLTVIPNGVTPEAFEIAGEARQPGLVVTAARLHPDKGTETFLDAVSRLADAFPDTRALILGGHADGYEEYARQIVDRAASIGPSGTVTIAGDVRDPYRAWAHASVYVQPSFTESFGLAALEAMAGGLPVVASRVGGLEELVEHGRTGFLVAPGDGTGFAAAIGRLFSDPDLARTMGAAGRAKARSLTVAAMADRFIEVYARVAR